MYLTRDEDGTLCLHSDFPTKIIVNDYTSFTSSDMIFLDEDIMPELTHETSPMKVKLIRDE